MGLSLHHPVHRSPATIASVAVTFHAEPGGVLFRVVAKVDWSASLQGWQRVVTRHAAHRAVGVQGPVLGYAYGRGRNHADRVVGEPWTFSKFLGEAPLGPRPTRVGFNRDQPDKGRGSYQVWKQPSYTIRTAMHLGAPPEITSGTQESA